MTRLLFIVPAYNESANLPAVVADLRAHYPAAEIAVVNDHSTDDTAKVARALGVTVLELPCNLGIGGAVQTGLLYAARGAYDIAVQFDGDGQHCADQVEKLLRLVQAGACDAALGSRFLSPSDYHPPLLRRLGIAVFRMVNSLVLQRTITDNTSGFRAYNRAAIEYLARDYPHDYPEPETVITLCRQGFRIQEVPVRMRERQNGHSSITFWRSIYYMFKVLLAIFVGATRRSIHKPSETII